MIRYPVLNPQNTSLELVVATGSTTPISLGDRFAQVISVKDYGAKGDGSTNDTAAIQAAANALTNGSAFFFPAGNYIITSAITISNISFAMFGLGRGVSNIIQNGTNVNGFTISLNSLVFRVQFSDFTLVAGNNSTGTALSINRLASASSSQTGPTIARCEFFGANTATCQWGTCIYLNYGWNANIIECLIKGMDGANTCLGIVCDNRGTAINFQRNLFYSLDSAIEFTNAGTNFSEGWNVIANQIVACNTGVNGVFGDNAPLAQIIGNHMACLNAGIVAHSHPQIYITNNSFYRYPGAATWTGITLDQTSPQCMITSNGFYGFQSTQGGTATGIIGGSADGALITTNTFNDLLVGVNGTAGAFSALVTLNNFASNVSTATTGLNASSVVTGNVTL